ncbi:transcription factor bHLH52-like [Phalaenopsis equestris]|uniref:transcription factor bHLH52-like n=1 Tax=Phalaenopsis equestris TaxID=78828 RepID=UPI0009E194D0|nr:transcription factor bHLH52-like [Phalaenopsis equestris]
MESSYRTRILVSPSLSTPITFNDCPSRNEVDYGGFVPFPSLLPDQTGTASTVSFPASDISFHPFMMIEQMDPASRTLIPAATSFKIDSQGFIQLPNLLSLEPFQDPAMERFVSNATHCQSVEHISLIQSSAPHKRSRLYSQYWRCPPLQQSVLNQQQLDSGKKVRQTQSARSTERSRQRRQIVSERTRILEKLMPWERRLDTGTMLEEACKYVKFLEAQVTALETMPVASRFMPSSVPPGKAFGLERLTRPQLLQVMVTSAKIQDILYKKGFCVVSAEQVAILRQTMERRLQPLLLLGHLGVQS